MFTCNIDLFEQHITLRFFSCKVNEQIIDVMSTHQKPGPPPTPRYDLTSAHPFEPTMTPA